MNTECTAVQLEFPGVGRRRLVARFDGGAISSDAGALLLKAVEARTGLLAGASRCFVDHRDPQRIEHSVEELVSQRVVALALGYEDLNDHDELRHDVLLASVVGKEDPTGSTRVQPRDRGKALAGKSTLNRLELTPDDASGSSRYKKIVADESGLDAWFVEQFVSAHERAPVSIVLDVDATRRPVARSPGGSVLPWLLPLVLLSAVVHILRGAPAVRTASPLEHRWCAGDGGRARTHHCADTSLVATGAGHCSG